MYRYIYIYTYAYIYIYVYIYTCGGQAGARTSVDDENELVSKGVRFVAAGASVPHA